MNEISKFDYTEKLVLRNEVCDIYHYPEKCKFETIVDGCTAYVEYTLDGQVMNIIHTIVPKEIGGRGIARILVAICYETACEHGYKVEASCSYADVWLKRNMMGE